MKPTVFSKMMLYLTVFFLLLCGGVYFMLSSGFEKMYSQSRTDHLTQNIAELRSSYEASGNTPELQARIAESQEAGTTIQLIAPETGETHHTEENAEANGQGGSGGNGNGQGKAANGEQRIGQGQQQMIEAQVHGHGDHEIFTLVTGNSEHQVEWLTYKEIAADGTEIVGRIPMYSIHEVVDIVQKFLVGLILVILVSSLIFAFFFARSISKPVVELKNLAGAMGQLQFDKKYKGRRKDEIGELGDTLNQISQKLENTINELQTELNKERTLDKMRKRFTAQVSHEIQTPLAIIKSYAEALEDDLLESEGEKEDYYKTIGREADRVSTIASDLLDLAQIESGAYQLKKEKANGEALLTETVERFRKTYPYKHIEFTAQNTAPLEVVLDPKRMEQVFYNLLTNAIKHVEPENGEIQVVSQETEKDWRIEVYNEGKRIPEEAIDQIWAYFYKAPTEKKGTGLGLAIVKGIIDCHGGKVAVCNEEKGVRFSVTLPKENL